MRCHICDRVLEKPDYNEDLKGYEPCPTCLQVIDDTVGAWYDRPYADDGDWDDESVVPLNEEYSYDVHD